MHISLLILFVEACAIYFLVLWAHSFRTRIGLAGFYALIGGLTAVMSWVTDAGVTVEFAGITFMVGSTVFYTSLLLGVFVVYVFDGPRATRLAIFTIAGVSTLVPLIATALHFHMKLSPATSLSYVPDPSLRINAASVATTVADLIFLAMAWEFLGKPRFRVQLWLRAFLTLLGVMWLDVLLFATAAFAGQPDYLNIMKGTLVSRLIISLFVTPFLYVYLNWQSRKQGHEIGNRPVMAILKEMAEVRAKLDVAEQEIERRRKAEKEKEQLIEQLRASISRIHKLEGLLPVCSGCKRIRTRSESTSSAERWRSLEDYVREETAVRFSHGLCPDCMTRLYPAFSSDDADGNEPSA